MNVDFSFISNETEGNNSSREIRKALSNYPNTAGIQTAKSYCDESHEQNEEKQLVHLV